MADQLIFGFHAVRSRLRQEAESVHELFAEEGRHDPRMRELLAVAASRGVRVVPMPKARLDAMAAGGRHQGVVARVAPIRLAQSLDAVLDGLEEPPLLLMLDGVQDPHNLGACLRVADAFGAHAVVAPKDRAAGITPTVAKVASGAAETVPFIAVTNLARTLRELKERGIWVAGAAGEAETGLYEARLAGPLAWVLGAENEGLRRLTRETCDELIRIPMLGAVESLNVSVAAGVCLSETRRQRRVAHTSKKP
ncbi:MAG: 23S rRNA (guanosine(2251)-2'-O)-methyltransferase RlmB [Betaproteobacteria bacterium]|nr:23S rRNA (guanosine(2251)-2'-O)-methyltransferase RlmB [Betaproteobacteria bacterium]